MGQTLRPQLPTPGLDGEGTASHRTDRRVGGRAGGSRPTAGVTQTLCAPCNARTARLYVLRATTGCSARRVTRTAVDRRTAGGTGRTGEWGSEDRECSGLAQRSQESMQPTNSLRVCTCPRESLPCHMTPGGKGCRGRAQPQRGAFTFRSTSPEGAPERRTRTPAAGLSEGDRGRADSPRSRPPCHWLRGSRV